MADKAVVHMGENSPEYIALRLFKEVMVAEDMSLSGGGGTRKADRKYMLDTYAECLTAVRGYRNMD